METVQACPACGARWRGEQTCQQHFHQMLAWEWEYPGYWDVHHLMVLSYHLQHPNLYSPEGLSGAMRLLEQFVEQGANPHDVRHQQHETVNSHNRAWKVKGTPASHGVYVLPLAWSMTAANVIANGAENYCESVRAWARSIYETLTVSGNYVPA